MLIIKIICILFIVEVELFISALKIISSKPPATWLLIPNLWIKNESDLKIRYALMKCLRFANVTDANNDRQII